MIFCDYHHEEIVYDCDSCPLCDATDKIKVLENIIESRDLDILDYERVIKNLESEIDELKKNAN